MQVIVSDSHDINENLALEQRLLGGSGEFALLYVNKPCVVVGRNQTIEAEVDTDFCLNHCIPVVKRLSGGGTVWHDRGNVNYSFVLDRDGKSPLDCDFTRPVVDALAALGLKVVRDKRNALFVDGLKVSGTAAMFTRGRVLFHGTLLFGSDLGMLGNACRGRKDVPAKVRSVSDRVGNIGDMLAEPMTFDEFVDYLAGFLSGYDRNTI